MKKKRAWSQTTCSSPLTIRTSALRICHTLAAFNVSFQFWAQVNRPGTVPRGPWLTFSCNWTSCFHIFLNNSHFDQIQHSQQNLKKDAGTFFSNHVTLLQRFSDFVHVGELCLPFGSCSDSLFVFANVAAFEQCISPFEWCNLLARLFAEFFDGHDCMVLVETGADSSEHKIAMGSCCCVGWNVSCSCIKWLKKLPHGFYINPLDANSSGHSCGCWVLYTKSGMERMGQKVGWVVLSCFSFVSFSTFQSISCFSKKSASSQMHFSKPAERIFSWLMCQRITLRTANIVGTPSQTWLGYMQELYVVRKQKSSKWNFSSLAVTMWR